MESGNTASICLGAPSKRLKDAFEPGRDVQVQLGGSVCELTLSEDRTELMLDLKSVSVRPDGKRTISGLIDAKQKKAGGYEY